MPTDTFDIQELVNASGVPRRTIYFYVQQGLLPPPQGAGLAARYTEEHKARLQLIPLMRREGLRLDEIRQQFSAMSADDMRKKLAAVQAKEQHPVAHAPAPAGQDFMRVPLRHAPAGYPSERRFLHYSLPAGVTLVAPEDLSTADRARLEQLLQAARQIFSGSPFLTGDLPGSTPPDGSSHSQEI